MDKNKGSNVRVLIAVENQIVRSGVNNALRDAGFRNLLQISTPEQIDILEKESFDLIILSSHMGDRPYMPVIGAMRDGKMNHHAFPIVILLLPEAGQAMIGEAISSGADDVLLMPVSTGQLIGRVNQLAGSRKPFILTRDYTGPDRRREARPGTPALQLNEPPNPLKAKLEGLPDNAMKQLITLAGRRMNQLKMEAYGRQIDWIVRVVGEMFHSGVVDSDKLASYADSLKRMAHDLPSRLGDAMNKRIANLLTDVIGSADHILRDGLLLKPADLELISAACMALANELGKLGGIEGSQRVA